MCSATGPRICLVEDDSIMGTSLCDRFELDGYAVDWHRNAETATASLGRRQYAMVVSDINLPRLSGGDMFERLLAQNLPLPPFIFITGYGAIEQAVRLLKLGAADYVTKPFDLDALMEKIRALASAPLASAGGTLGISAAMRRVEETLPRLARHAGTVLITGESGVGKEHAAQALHALAAGGAAAPFIAVNCGALTESLLEAELFGHEKGAFTGAVRQRKGVFEQAHGGTLFLDEVGEMSPAMQVKLLRAIQNRTIVRVGGETPIPVELRLICATHRDLKKMVEQGNFREDLFYRINVINLRIPPLRERKEDILWFAQRFLEECTRRHGGPRRQIGPATEQALLAYPWPGNIRELMHAVERACILNQGGVLGPEAFFEDETLAFTHNGERESLSAYLDACERAYIERTLSLEQGQIGRTADRLGISRKNLWEKMKKLGMQDRPGG
jgi:DNA-binding NtrC family response regulator